jgi:thymidylate synthase
VADGVPETAAWPVYCRQGLTVGDPAAGVGVCTLWTPRDRIARALDPGSYAAVGNLYSAEGIGLLIRNVLANPGVRHLVLCGVDLTGTGAALARLVEHGLGRDRRVVGDGTPLDPALPSEAVETFRRGVVLHDLRGERDPAAVRALVETLPLLPPFAAPALYPRPEPKADALPGEQTGQVVRAPTVALAWLRALAAVMRFGQEAPTAYGGRQRELLALTAVVEAEDPAAPQLPLWLPLTRETLERYATQVLEATAPRGVAYTYGQRLRAWRGRDQIAGLAAELRSGGESRRAVAALWDPLRDAGAAHPPCLVALQARLRGGRLMLVAFLRSSDLFRAWPANAFALRRLQARLAAEVGADGLDDLVMVAGSAHVYEECWPAARALLEREGGRLERSPRFVRDPRGSFVLRVEADGLAADHYGPDGALLGTHRGGSADELRRRLAPLVSLTGHALYLGGELARAELALRNDLTYVQDEPLALPG